MTGIGTLRETALHAALKEWKREPGDEAEARVEGYLIDLRRGETLIEIQTRNFAAIRAKLRQLVERHKVCLVHPIAREKYIVKLAGRARPAASRRKSPRRGGWLHLFTELTALPDLAAHPNFALEIVLTREEEIQAPGRGGWRRRGWKIADRRLLEVLEARRFETPADYAAVLPPTLPGPFTCREAAAALACPLPLAQKIAYCLRRMGAIQAVGKRGNSVLYERNPH